MQRILVGGAVVAVVAAAVVGNVLTETTGILPENAVTESTKTTRADAYVRAHANFEEYAYLLYDFGAAVDAEDLRGLAQLHHTLRDSGLVVSSLVSHPDFQFQNGVLAKRRFIPSNYTAFSAPQWKQRVQENKGVYGKLIFTDFSYAVLAVKMEQGFDEIAAGRNLVEILEGKEIPKWKWYFKQDITPANPRVVPAGSILARITMYGTINYANLIGVAIGLLFAFIFLLYFFRSSRAAGIAVLFILAALVCTRAAIGYLDLLGVDTAESVYTILAYASIIIAGVSFHTHAFAGMRHLEEEGMAGGWRKLTRFIGPVIALTAIISILNFLSLLTFDVTVIRDMGIHAAIGIGIAWILAMYVFPIFAHTMVTPSREGGWKPLEYISSLLHNLSQRISAGIALASVAVIAAFAAFGIWRGWLPVGSQPLEYIRGTAVYSAVEEMNKKGRPGFLTLDFAFQPAAGNLRDPEAVKSFFTFLQQVRAVEGVRRVHSIFDDVTHISREVYQKPVPETSDEVAFVFQNGIQSSVAYWDFQEQLESDRMWRFTVTTTKEGKALGKVRNRVDQLPQNAAYDVYPFGRNAVYPDVDQAIIRGKPKNAAAGHGVVIFFITIWLWWRIRGKHTYAPLRSFCGAWLASLPFVFSFGCLVLAMIALSIPLDVATAVITALAINASVDFSLYFVHAYLLGTERGEVSSPLSYAFEVEGAAITADMVANSLCFITLIVSPFKPVQELGIIMILMLIAAWIGTLLIMPPTLSLFFSHKEYTTIA